MLAAAQALPDVQTAQLTTPTTVGILFKDGTPMVVDTFPLNDTSNHLAPGTGIPSAATLSRKINKVELHLTNDAILPTGRKAYLFDEVPVDFTSLGLPYPPTTTSATWFQNAGYTPVLQSGSIADLINLKDASVFTLEAHGGWGLMTPLYDSQTALTVLFFIGTTVPIEQDYVDALRPELQAGELGYYAAVDYTIDPTTHLPVWQIYDTFSFTPKFVRNYMTFTDDSLVVMNVCHLMETDQSKLTNAGVSILLAQNEISAVQDMVQAFFDSNAGAVLGWDDTEGALDGVDTTWYFLDRVLGAGSAGYGTYLSNPPNRPYNVNGVFARTASIAHNYPNSGRTASVPLSEAYGYYAVTDPSTGEVSTDTSRPPIIAHLTLQYSPKMPANSPSLALVPTIAQVQLNNNTNALTLTGDFGGNYTNRAVTINSVPMPATWTSGSVSVSPLPITAGGNVQVTIDGASSNQVLINQWNSVPLTMVTQNGGSDTRTVTCSINLRTSFDTLAQIPDGPRSTSLVTTDQVVLQNGQCSFVSTNPPGGDTLPWFNIFTTGGETPATLASVWSIGQSLDGSGGGTVGISIQAGYFGGQFDFLDTSSTNQTQLLTFDASTGLLRAGTANQSSDTLSWAATPAAFQPKTTTQPQQVRPNVH
jgi:hypothetical protein